MLSSDEGKIVKIFVILIFNNKTNFIHSWDEHEKSFMNSEPDQIPLTAAMDQCLYLSAQN